jgi:uncharacterized protein YeaC (DUF1315 family)
MIKPLSLFALISICIAFNNIALAEKLPQADYDRFIAQQTKIVNETKQILDQPDSHAGTHSQRQAFCQRLTAYQAIQNVSEENQELDLAPTMAMIARNFLERQSQSMNASGMTTAVFCKSREVK